MPASLVKAAAAANRAGSSSRRPGSCRGAAPIGSSLTSGFPNAAAWRAMFST